MLFSKLLDVSKNILIRYEEIEIYKRNINVYTYINMYINKEITNAVLQEECSVITYTHPILFRS